MNIGNQIKTLREKKGWIQKELAAKLEMSQSAVAAWENDRNGPNPTQRKKLCEIFRITEAELFGGQPTDTTLSPEILSALQDPVAVKALLITHKNSQDIKNAIRTMLECLPSLSFEKRQAILALCK